MVVHILTREALYERVWTDSLSSTAKALGTNPTDLKSRCLAAGIPTPSTGYWSKLRAGKKVVTPLLPPRPPGARAIITIGWYRTWWRRRSEMLSDPIPLKPEFPESIEDLATRLAAQIEAAPERTTFAKRKPLADGRSGEVLDLLRATLSKMDAAVQAGDEPELFHAYACCFGAAFTLTASDSSLILRLQFYEGLNTPPFGKVFVDRPDCPLEHQIKEIAIALMVAAELRYRDSAEVDYRHRLERRATAEKDARERTAKAKRLLEQRRRDREERRRQFLFAQADDWRTAKDIRGFVAEILSQAGPPRPEINAWAEWALGEADAIDPVKRDELLAYPGLRLAESSAS
jgi:hypothetical protein